MERIEELLRSRGEATTLLVDAGPLDADVGADARRHAACPLAGGPPGPLVVPLLLVVTEVVCLLESRWGTDAARRFLGDVAAGNLLAEPMAAVDWLRMAEPLAADGDLHLATADASVVALAERRNITGLATLGRPHFAVARPAHAAPFDIVP